VKAADAITVCHGGGNQSQKVLFGGDCKLVLRDREVWLYSGSSICLRVVLLGVGQMCVEIVGDKNFCDDK
jgi:hypothetical protein